MNRSAITREVRIQKRITYTFSLGRTKAQRNLLNVISLSM
jgi:hypothetical protein